MAALVAVTAVAGGRLPVAEAVKVDTTEAEIAAGISVEEAATVAGEGRSAAAAIVVALDGKATSAFPDIESNMHESYSTTLSDWARRSGNAAIYVQAEQSQGIC